MQYPFTNKKIKKNEVFVKVHRTQKEIEMFREEDVVTTKTIASLVTPVIHKS